MTPHLPASSPSNSIPGDPAQAHLAQVTAPPRPAVQMLTLSMLTRFENTSACTAPMPASLAGIKAWQIFQQQMAHGNSTLPAGGNRSMEEAKPLMLWFGSMATPQEKNILLPLKAVASVGAVTLISKVDPPAQEAMRKFISQRLDVLLRARLIQCFFDARLPCPPGLLTWCGGGKNGNSTDDHLNATAPATYQRYLKQMGVTAIVPVQTSLLQWRQQHKLITFRPDEVLQLPDVLTQVNPNWRMTTSGVNGLKKHLVLEGFSVREEWLDLARTRPWSNAWSVDKDVLWQDEYSRQKRAQKQSGSSAHENAAAGQ